MLPVIYIESRQLGHGQHLIEFSQCRTDNFRDHPAYWIGLRERRQVTKYSQLVFLYQAGHPSHPSVIENSLIGDKVLQTITRA